MKKIVLYTLIGLIGTVILSCKKYNEEFIGPPLGLAPDDFEVSGNSFTVSNTFPNFVSDTIHFMATFNATVNWTIEIRGENGAYKEIKGYSNFIDASNSKWAGTTDIPRLFGQGEDVTATLKIFGWQQTLSTTLQIANERDRGIVLGKFNNINVNHGSMNFQDPSSFWWFYSFETGEYDQVDKVSSTDTPEGLHHLRIAGHDQNQSYYVGKVGLSAPSGVFAFGNPSLNDFYFNLFVKGAGTDASKDYKLVIETFEDDSGNGLQYDGSEDKFTYTISLKFDGWKLIQAKYSDFILESPASTGGKVHSPNKIGNIGFFIGAATAAGLSQTDVIDTGIDYFTIATNGPMIP